MTPPPPVTLRTQCISSLDLRSVASEDTTIHCTDGQVSANSLLLAVISPYLRNLLESRTEHEENVQISCPGVNAGQLRGLLDNVYSGDSDIIFLESLRHVFFPAQFQQHYFEISKKDDGCDIEYVKPELKVESDDLYEDETKIEEFSEEIFSCDDIPFNDVEISEDYIDEENDETYTGKKCVKKKNKKQKSVQSSWLKNFCNVCEKYFRTKNVMMNHVLKRHGPKLPPTCEFCSETFDTYRARTYHRDKYHKEKVPCSDCGKLYFQSKLLDHIKMKHSDDKNDPKTCDICGDVFINSHKFYHHMKRHRNKSENIINNRKMWLQKFENDCHCEIKCPNFQSKVDHMKLVHEGYQKCPQCQRIVKNIDQKEHSCQRLKSRIKDEPCWCPLCGKYYEKKASLWYHMKAEHTSEPVPCEICGKVFRSYVHKNTHVEKVHKPKPPCNLCGKKVSNLKEHMYTIHTADENKKFKCQHCGKGFSEGGRLRIHMNIHLQLKPFKCREGCEAAYSDLSNRNQHERKIHGAKKLPSGGRPPKL